MKKYRLLSSPSCKRFDILALMGIATSMPATQKALNVFNAVMSCALYCPITKAKFEGNLNKKILPCMCLRCLLPLRFKVCQIFSCCCFFCRQTSLHFLQNINYRLEFSGQEFTLHLTQPLILVKSEPLATVGAIFMTCEKKSYFNCLDLRKQVTVPIFRK